MTATQADAHFAFGTQQTQKARKQSELIKELIARIEQLEAKPKVTSDRYKVRKKKTAIGPIYYIADTTRKKSNIVQIGHVDGKPIQASSFSRNPPQWMEDLCTALNVGNKLNTLRKETQVVEESPVVLNEEGTFKQYLQKTWLPYTPLHKRKDDSDVKNASFWEHVAIGGIVEFLLSPFDKHDTYFIKMSSDEARPVNFNWTHPEDLIIKPVRRTKLRIVLQCQPLCVLGKGDPPIAYKDVLLDSAFIRVFDMNVYQKKAGHTSLTANGVWNSIAESELCVPVTKGQLHMVNYGVPYDDIQAVRSTDLSIDKLLGPAV